MISPEKLIRMARKRRKLAVIRRKSIRLPKTRTGEKQSIALKGHFVVYPADQRRFVLPLVFLKTDVFRELLVAQEEYGRNGPIKLPWDALFMGYAVSLIRRHAAKDLEKASLISVASVHCSLSSNVQLEETIEQLLLCSF